MSGATDDPPTVLAANARCPRCRYNLAGLTAPGTCPECGRAFTTEEAINPALTKRADTLFIAICLVIALAAPLTACLWLTPGSAWTWLVTAAAVFAGLLSVPRLLRRRRGRPSKCPSCGYSWVGLPESGACPECGQEFETIPRRQP